jgi:hypothetical protein
VAVAQLSYGEATPSPFTVFTKTQNTATPAGEAGATHTNVQLVRSVPFRVCVTWFAAAWTSSAQAPGTEKVP